MKKYFEELRSEEVQEILTRPPRWILRWGITLVFVILILVFCIAWLVRYPDLVKASFKLTSFNAPKSVISYKDGKIVKIFVTEGQLVKRGSTLAYLESIANHEEVIRLSHKLVRAWQLANKGNLEALEGLKFEDYRNLGELQNAY